MDVNNSPDLTREKALLVGVKLPSSTMEREKANLKELETLAKSAGAYVTGSLIQQRTRLSGSTYIGRGMLDKIAQEVKEKGANLIIFDDALTPAQARNIEAVVKVNVIDRTELILDIFSKRARTRQARIQVEIAQLTYALPRLRRLWDHLSRQEGGIGTRGPGEKQLEVDRRRVRERISHLKKDLEKISKGTLERRKKRKGLFNVTLVGYTNAGKSTLLNALSGSEVLESRMMFSTLDSTTRRVERNDGSPALFTDTVGFIRKLPPNLVASFRSTLLDVERADLLLHVVDASGQGFKEEIEVVNGILDDIFRGVADGGEREHEVPTWLVLNKIDKLDKERAARLKTEMTDAHLVSAAEGMGVDELLARVEEHLENEMVRVEVAVPLSDGRTIAFVEESGKVEAREVKGESLVITALIGRKTLPVIEERARVTVRPRRAGRR